MKREERLNIEEILKTKDEIKIDENLSKEEMEIFREAYEMYKKELYKIINAEEEKQLLNLEN